MKPSVYVETSVLSYLAARPSRDLLIAAHQQVTHEWWGLARKQFALCVSEVVLDEASEGDPEAAARRLELVGELPVLDFTDEVRPLAFAYQRRVGLPDEARVDLTHVALAVVHETDYLVTWNCRHIANAQLIRRLNEVNQQLDRFMPLIVTPEGFMDIVSGEKP